MKNTNVKAIAATIGAGALIAMGGLTMATSSAEPTEPAPPGPVPVEEATIGESVAGSEVAGSEVADTPTSETESGTAISVAPEITGAAPLPSEEQGLPG